MTSNQYWGGPCFARLEYAGLALILAQTDDAFHSRTIENSIPAANSAKTRRDLSMSLIIPPGETKIPTSPEFGEKWGTLVLIQYQVLRIP